MEAERVGRWWAGASLVDASREPVVQLTGTLTGTLIVSITRDSHTAVSISHNHPHDNNHDITT